MPTSGLFIVLEGADGSGKGTQFKLLAERLSAVGYDVVTFDFPRYSEPSSHFVRQYLNGKYGPAGQINPYAASMFYALDRYEAAPAIRSALGAGKVVLSNRYAGSNMAHQGSKFGSEAQKRGFFMWADSLEFQLLGIPRPDLNIYLRVPADISFKLIERKAARSYTDKKRDEHESSIQHLQESVATYDLLCRLFPRDYRAIESTQDGRLMSIPAINELAWEALKPFLHDRLARVKPSAKTVSLSEARPLTAGKELSKVTLAPALPPKNLSYRIEALSYRSAAQLNTYPEARITTSPSQFQKTTNNYFRPPNAQPGVWKDFKVQIESLEAKRSSLLKKFKKAAPADSSSLRWLAEATLPMGALLKAQLLVNQAELRSLSTKLALNDSLELKLLATQLNPSAAAYSSDNNKTADWQKYVSSSFGGHDSQPKLLSYWPKREFELLETLAYSQSVSGAAELGSSLEELQYSQKAQLLKQMLGNMRSIDGLPAQPSYQVEALLSSVAAFYLSDNGLGKIEAAQSIDPRYGYEVSVLLEKNNLENEYLEVFDDSLKLYGGLQSSKQPQIAPYAALGGHRSRYILKITAAQLFELANRPHPGLADEVVHLADELKTQTSDIHPIFWQVWSSGKGNLSQRQHKNVGSPDARRPKRRRKA